MSKADLYPLVAGFTIWAVWVGWQLHRLGRQLEAVHLLQLDMADLMAGRESRVNELREEWKEDQKKEDRRARIIGGVVIIGVVAWWWFTANH